MRAGWIAAAAALAVASCTVSEGPGAASDRTTSAAMAEIVAALRVALPLSLSAERFSAPESQPALTSALGALRAGAHELESHGRSQDASFAYLSRSLARDAEEIKRRFDDGRTEEARFLLGALVDDCVGCHSRLPGNEDSDLGRSLYEAAPPSALSAVERARLEVATHQFERALESYEALLRAPDTPPGALDLEGVIDDYLTLAIRVREDPPRARAALAELAARPDVPSHLARLLAQWIAACDQLRDSIRAEALLPEAERVLDEGEVLSREGRDRAGLVHQLVASSLLLRYVDAHPEGGPESSHAYFLLGVTSLQSGRSWWLGEAEGYLETAIRQAPGSDWAKRAYVFLEEQTLANYSGSGGVHVPPDVRQRLQQLQKVAEGEEG